MDALNSKVQTTAMYIPVIRFGKDIIACASDKYLVSNNLRNK